MTGEETFEFAAAVAGVSVGLAAVLILAILAIIGSWRLFRHASEAQQAAMEASITVAEMVRRIESPDAPATDVGAPAADEAPRTELLRSVPARRQSV